MRRSVFNYFDTEWWVCKGMLCCMYVMNYDSLCHKNVNKPGIAVVHIDQQQDDMQPTCAKNVINDPAFPFRKVNIAHLCALLCMQYIKKS